MNSKRSDQERKKFTELVEHIINTKFNKYFKCSEIIDEILALRHNIDLKDIINYHKRTVDPYYDERPSLRGYVTHVLVDLHIKGIIEKHSKRFWKKL